MKNSKKKSTISTGWIVLGGVGVISILSYVYNNYVNASNDEMYVHYVASDNIVSYTSNKLASGLISLINSSKQIYKDKFDMDSDTSLQKYVNKNNPLAPSYIPSDLEDIDLKYIISSSNYNKLRAPARDAIEKMAKKFYDEMDVKLYLVSAYRSYNLQKHLIDEGCSALQCAMPGTSEHQAGLAVDIHVEYGSGMRLSMKPSSKYYNWLADNAHNYGFHNTFQKGVHVDGQMQEGWHWRYLGVPLATYLHDNDMTIGEYYKLQNSKDI